MLTAVIEHPHSPASERPAGVIAFLQHAAACGLRTALVLVAGTKGGAVRAPGAMMAVADDGQVAGYVSGGCVDADVAGHAIAAITSGVPLVLRYGEGSPFVDIVLPCGGTIDLLILPGPNQSVIDAIATTLAKRQPFTLTASLDGGFAMHENPGADRDAEWDGTRLKANYIPELRLRVAGRGADLLALCRLAGAAGIPTILQSPDPVCLETAPDLPVERVTQLTVPAAIPAAHDDPWTAFVLMFHDRDWEVALLSQALEGEAFYIGAVGSRRAQARRLDALAEASVPAEAQARIRGPIGLLPAMREASALAVSALAEILSLYHEKPPHADR